MVILPSSRAQKDLRDYKRAEGVMVRIVAKKWTAANSAQTTIPGDLLSFAYGIRGSVSLWDP